MRACPSLQLQGCAKRSVSLLDRAAAGQHTFDPLFLTKHSPLTMYDYLFHVSIPQPKAAQLQTQDVPRWVLAEKKLLGLVKQVRHYCAGEALSLFPNSPAMLLIQTWLLHQKAYVWLWGRHTSVCSLKLAFLAA